MSNRSCPSLPREDEYLQQRIVHISRHDAMPSVMIVPDRRLIGQTSEELTTIVQCCTYRAWENHVAIGHGAMPQEHPGNRTIRRVLGAYLRRRLSGPLRRLFS